MHTRRARQRAGIAARAAGMSDAPLTRLRTGGRARVVSLEGATERERSKLMALGVLPGEEVRLLQRFPSFVIRIGYTQLALDRETAAVIVVASPGHVAG